MLALSRDTSRHTHVGTLLLGVVPDVPRQHLGEPVLRRRWWVQKLVLPGPHLDGESVYELMKGEGGLTIMQGSADGLD